MMTNTDAIILPVGAKAEPGTCGSCLFFYRRPEPYNSHWSGQCTIELPYKCATKEWDGDSRPPAIMSDTDRCDFHRPDGKIYIVSKQVG